MHDKWRQRGMGQLIESHVTYNQPIKWLESKQELYNTVYERTWTLIMLKYLARNVGMPICDSWIPVCQTIVCIMSSG